MPDNPGPPQTFSISFIIGEGGPIPGALTIVPGASIPTGQLPTPPPASLTSGSSYSLLLWMNLPVQQAGAQADFIFSVSTGNAPTVISRIVVSIPVGVHKVSVQQLTAPAVTGNTTLTIQAIVSGNPVPFTTPPQTLPIQAISPGS